MVAEGGLEPPTSGLRDDKSRCSWLLFLYFFLINEAEITGFCNKNASHGVIENRVVRQACAKCAPRNEPISLLYIDS